MDFPQIDKSTWFYKNCKTNRQRGAKICQECPFRAGIEAQENYRKDLGVELLFDGSSAVEDLRGYCQCSPSIPASTGLVCTACGRRRRSHP